MNVAEILIKGLRTEKGTLKPVPCELKKLPAGTHCAFSGEEIAAGYPVRKVVPKSVGNYADLLTGNSGYLSPAVALAFKNTWNLGSRVIFEDGTQYHPLFDRKAATKQERMCFSQLVRLLWPDKSGQRCLIIVATDFKKRVWHKARVGVLSENTAVLLFNGDVLSNVYICWPKLLEVLEQVEAVYSSLAAKEKHYRGRAMRAVRESMYDTVLRRHFGIPWCREWEDYFAPLRGTPELTFAILIGQAYQI